MYTKMDSDIDDICPVCDSTCTCVKESSQEESEIDIDEMSYNNDIDIDDSSEIESKSYERPTTSGKDIWVQKYLQNKRVEEDNHYIEVSSSPITSPIFNHSIGYKELNLNRGRSSSISSIDTPFDTRNKNRTTRIPAQQQQQQIESSPIYNNSQYYNNHFTSLSPINEIEDISDIESIHSVGFDSDISNNDKEMEDLEYSSEGSDNNEDDNEISKITINSEEYNNSEDNNEDNYSNYEQSELDNFKYLQIEEDYLIQKVMLGYNSWDSQMEEEDDEEDFNNNLLNFEAGNNNNNEVEPVQQHSFLEPNHPWYTHKPVYLSDLLDEPPRKCPTLSFDNQILSNQNGNISENNIINEVEDEIKQPILFEPVFKGNLNKEIEFAKELHNNKKYMENNHKLLNLEQQEQFNLPNSNSFKPLSTINSKNNEHLIKHSTGTLPESISTGWKDLDTKLVYDSFRSCPHSTINTAPNSPKLNNNISKDDNTLKDLHKIVRLNSDFVPSTIDKELNLNQFLYFDKVIKSPENKPFRNEMEFKSAEALARWDKYPVTAFRHHLNQLSFNNKVQYNLKRKNIIYTPHTTPIDNNTPISTRPSSPNIQDISNGIQHLDLNINDLSIPPSLFLPRIQDSPILNKKVYINDEDVKTSVPLVLPPPKVLVKSSKSKQIKKKKNIKYNHSNVYNSKILFNSKTFGIKLIKLNKGIINHRMIKINKCKKNNKQSYMSSKSKKSIYNNRNVNRLRYRRVGF